jgi:hypothetical protein
MLKSEEGSCVKLNSSTLARALTSIVEGWNWKNRRRARFAFKS